MDCKSAGRTGYLPPNAGALEQNVKHRTGLLGGPHYVSTIIRRALMAADLQAGAGVSLAGAGTSRKGAYFHGGRKTGRQMYRRRPTKTSI